MFATVLYTHWKSSWGFRKREIESSWNWCRNCNDTKFWSHFSIKSREQWSHLVFIQTGKHPWASKLSERKWFVMPVKWHLFETAMDKLISNPKDGRITFTNTQTFYTLSFRTWLWTQTHRHINIKWKSEIDCKMNELVLPVYGWNERTHTNKHTYTHQIIGRVCELQRNGAQQTGAFSFRTVRKWLSLNW